MCIYIYIYFHILAYIFDIVRLGSNNVTCVLIPSYSFWKFNLVNNNNNITIYRLRYNFKSLFQILRFISWLSSLVDISDIIILHRKLFYYVCDLLCLTVNQLLIIFTDYHLLYRNHGQLLWWWRQWSLYIFQRTWLYIDK